MSELLYKPGDKVTIRSDLKDDTDYPVLYGPAAGKIMLLLVMSDSKLRSMNGNSQRNWISWQKNCVFQIKAEI